MPGLGSARIARLVSEFGSASAVLGLPEERLVAARGFGQATARLIAEADRSDLVDEQIRRADRLGATMLTVWDEDYPALLREIPDPPVLLWCVGERPWLERTCVAVVGTRTPTEYGRAMAARFARELASSGCCLVSGLAIGIDAIVHAQCVRAGGATVAVFGSGLDRVYPTRHRKLVTSIAQRGAAISEFAMGAKPEAGNFPRRNRIISGLAAGVLVVEARITGGAIITARLALDQNRDVFAIPGPIDASTSSGCNALIHRGEALLVSTPVQILAALGFDVEGKEPDRRPLRLESPEEQALWQAFGDDVKHVDDLCVSSALEVSTVLSLLLRWEFDGLVYKMPGNRYRRCGTVG